MLVESRYIESAEVLVNQAVSSTGYVTGMCLAVLLYDVVSCARGLVQ